jgi:hypothetical protein
VVPSNRQLQRTVTRRRGDGASAPFHFAPYSVRDFNLSTHAVTEAFIDELPRRRVTLDDVGKLCVAAGTQTPTGVSLYVRLIGVGEYRVPLFSFARYFSLPRAEQQRELLLLLREAINAAAAARSSDPTMALEVCSRVAAKDFPLAEISPEELHMRWGLV